MQDSDFDGFGGLDGAGNHRPQCDGACPGEYAKFGKHEILHEKVVVAAPS